MGYLAIWSTTMNEMSTNPNSMSGRMVQDGPKTKTSNRKDGTQTSYMDLHEQCCKNLKSCNIQCLVSSISKAGRFTVMIHFNVPVPV